ncbi:hypothetical protein K1T71_009909 [Dendrolimus kikuchii]|uniref:Uncharacterized protein n=1 Tax=Dendrolimus kikuchii TaxID=765133 RepID=A0ACC1CTD0_9NEOP|nr:hypothetical protein K1T71_009909 [Dendrolimus kikuchii]
MILSFSDEVEILGHLSGFNTRSDYNATIEIKNPINLEEKEGTEKQGITTETHIAVDETCNNEETDKIKCKIKLACSDQGMHRLLVKFIQKCLTIEDSKAMLNVLNLLIKMYKRIDDDYKKSNKFNRLLNRGNKCLKANPSKKFSHIKMIVDNFKLHDSAKRDERENDIIEIQDDDVINIDTECVLNNTVTNRATENSTQNIRNRIKFEDDEFVLADIINNKVKLSNNKTALNDIVHLDSSDSDEIELLDNKQSGKKQRGFLYKNDKPQTNSSRKISNKEEENVSDKKENNKDTNLLMPVAWSKAENEMTADEKIKQIESRIAVYKKKIAHYELKEVCNDTINSPYLITLKLKQKVVRLYESLCTIIGEVPIKRREVRLKVAKGFPSGPATRLEEFINNNIRADGNPPFPDFNDVLSCVRKANVNDNLGWKNDKVVAEAQALFEQCGRALQQRRQYREWRDVISRVNKDYLDEDPADKDPKLLTKLMTNKKIAMSKENDVFERYTKLQSTMTPVSMDMDDSDSGNDESDTSFKFEENTNEEDTELPVKRIKLERIDHSKIFDSSLVIEVSDSSDSDDSS